MSALGALEQRSEGYICSIKFPLLSSMSSTWTLKVKYFEWVGPCNRYVLSTLLNPSDVLLQMAPATYSSRLQ